MLDTTYLCTHLRHVADVGLLLGLGGDLSGVQVDPTHYAAEECGLAAAARSQQPVSVTEKVVPEISEGSEDDKRSMFDSKGVKDGT